MSMVRWFVFGLWLVCYGLLLGVFEWFGRIARFAVLVCVYDIVVVVVSCLCFSDYSCCGFWICLINSVVSHGLLCWGILLICVWVLYVFGYFGCFGLLGWVGCAFRFVVFGAYAADLLRLWL